MPIGFSPPFDLPLPPCPNLSGGGGGTRLVQPQPRLQPLFVLHDGPDGAEQERHEVGVVLHVLRRVQRRVLREPREDLAGEEDVEGDALVVLGVGLELRELRPEVPLGPPEPPDVVDLRGLAVGDGVQVAVPGAVPTDGWARGGVQGRRGWGWG